jgi:hypothetical protein
MKNHWDVTLLAMRHIGTRVWCYMGKGRVVTPLSGAPYLDLDMVLSEQGSGRRILSDALYHRPSVVKNEQGSSYLTRWMRRVRKLAEPSRVRVGTWNVGSLMGKL